MPGGGRPDRSPVFRNAVLGAGPGALGGLVATLAMYGVAALDFFLTGVPEGSWVTGAETAFGGSTGSFLGLSGTALHAVHGATCTALRRAIHGA